MAKGDAESPKNLLMEEEQKQKIFPLWTKQKKHKRWKSHMNKYSLNTKKWKRKKIAKRTIRNSINNSWELKTVELFSLAVKSRHSSFFCVLSVPLSLSYSLYCCYCNFFPTFIIITFYIVRDFELGRYQMMFCFHHQFFASIIHVLISREKKMRSVENINGTKVESCVKKMNPKFALRWQWPNVWQVSQASMILIIYIWLSFINRSEGDTNWNRFHVFSTFIWKFQIKKRTK